jgi:hypothetical protein
VRPRANVDERDRDCDRQLARAFYLALNECFRNRMVFGKHWTRRAAFFVTNGKSEAQCVLASRVCFSQAQVPAEDNP